MHDGETALNPQERTLEEAVGEPGEEYGGKGDDDVYECSGEAVRQVDFHAAVGSRQEKYQQRMDDIDAVGYLSNEVAHFVLQVDDGVVKLAHDAY